MKKTLNIEINVRRMEAQSILTTSNVKGSQDPVNDPTTAGAPVREGRVVNLGADGGVAPVRTGF